MYTYYCFLLSVHETIVKPSYMYLVTIGIILVYTYTTLPLELDKILGILLFNIKKKNFLSGFWVINSLCFFRFFRRNVIVMIYSPSKLWWNKFFAFDSFQNIHGSIHLTCCIFLNIVFDKYSCLSIIFVCSRLFNFIGWSCLVGNGTNLDRASASTFFFRRQYVKRQS